MRIAYILEISIKIFEKKNILISLHPYDRNVCIGFFWKVHCECMCNFTYFWGCFVYNKRDFCLLEIPYSKLTFSPSVQTLVNQISFHKKISIYHNFSCGLKNICN